MFDLLLLDINSCIEFSNFSIFVEFFINKHAYCNGALIFHFRFAMFINKFRPFWFISIKIYFDLVILSMFTLFDGPISGRSLKVKVINVKDVVLLITTRIRKFLF